MSQIQIVHNFLINIYKEFCSTSP